MARQIFGGTAADVAEDSAGIRTPGAVGTVWDGPTEGASQIADMMTAEGAPISQLTADAAGLIPPFYGPDDNSERLWVDFGGGRVAITSATIGDRLRGHLAALDPHGSTEAAIAAIQARMGRPLGVAQLDENGKVPAAQLPPCPCQTQPPQSGATPDGTSNTQLPR